MTEIATIDWFGRWGTSVFSENTAVFTVVAAPMAEWLRTLIFSTPNRSSSHRCQLEPSLGHCCWFEPSLGHVRQAKFCLRVVRCIFVGISHFRPTLPLTDLSLGMNYCEMILAYDKPVILL